MRAMTRMAVMDEPPHKTADETNEELVEEWEIHYAMKAAASGLLSPRRLADVFHYLASKKARRSKRLPPRSVTPTPEPRVAEAPQGKDASWTPGAEPQAVSSGQEDQPLSPERIAQLEREADASVDRAYSKPPRTARQ